MTTRMSIAQERHRQLFKQALAWRQGLTKQERIFLESYCLGKHPFGCDPLVTQWHRFALKIYLEEVKFELRAPPEDGKPGLLHVRHPALRSVCQRRGSSLVTSYTELSSLTAETLVEQVGLDVELGDLIEVVTLPGRAFSYLV